MKLKCFGTGAAEAIPALYCSCPLCEKAREIGGKEIRGRHLSTVDGVIQFDIGQDLFYQIQVLGLEPRKIRHLIITHSHSDHFDLDALNKRGSPFSLALDNRMEVIGSRETISLVQSGIEGDFAHQGLIPRAIRPYEAMALDGETMLTALPANHAPGTGAMIYVLERKGKKLLYAHDTGPLFPEVISWLSGRQLDGATLDCTGAYIGAGAHHMQLSSCGEAVSALHGNGGLKKGGIVVLSHFSHGGGALHAQLEQEAEKRGWIAAYDGMEIEI